MHVRAVGVEDPHHLDANLVLAVIVEEQRFRAALALVVAGARTQRVDVAPVAFRLRVDAGIAVHFGRGGLEHLGPGALGQSEHVDGADHARLGGLHGVELVMDGGGRAGEVVDLVHLHVERKADVVAHQLEAVVVEQGGDVAPTPGEVVVHAQHVVALRQEPRAQVRTEEPRTARHHDALAQEPSFCCPMD